MLSLILNRVALAIPSLIGVVIVTFLLTRALPGDPAAYFAGPAATEQAIAEIRAKLGTDRPLIEQFGRYVSDLAKGELGNSLTTGRPGSAGDPGATSGIRRTHADRLLFAVLVRCPWAFSPPRGRARGLDHVTRIVTTAGVSLPVFFTGLLLVYIFYYRLGVAPSPVGRLDVFLTAPPHVTGFYLIDAVIARDGEVFRGALKQLVLPALTLGIFALAPLARMTRASMLARALVGLRAPRRGRQACPVPRSSSPMLSAMLCCRSSPRSAWCCPSCWARMCWSRRSSPGRASVPSRWRRSSLRTSRRCRASCWRWRSIYCLHESRHRRHLWTRRSARKDRVVSGGTSSGFAHARYVITENPVTAFAFALFLLIVLAAVFGPWLVPYDPLASNTSRALRAPSAQHWFGTDQLGSRHLQPRRRRHEARSHHRGCIRGAGLPAGWLSVLRQVSSGGWTDRIVMRIADTIMAFPLFVLAMGIVAALGNSVTNIVIATAIVNFPLYARVARAEANIRRDAGYVEAAGSPATGMRASC